MRTDVSNAILVLNAGSSSLKFTEFVVGDGDALEICVSGNLEELYGRARFRAEDADGGVIGEHEWDEREPPKHAGGLEFLFDWLQAYTGDANLVAATATPAELACT